MVWAIPLAMAAAGMLKSNLVDRPREKRDRALAAETQRYSPWTGLKANQIREADPFGAALQGGMTGMQMGQDPGFTSMLGGGKNETSGLGAAAGLNAGTYTSQGLKPSEGYQSLYSRLAYNR